MPQFPDYDFQTEHLDLAGVRLHYVAEGPADANPVVMLHGNPSWSFYYRKLISALKGDHRVIVPDHIGMGWSDKPSDRDYEYTWARRVDDLQRLLDHLEIQRNITLVVHDWGGAIGMAFATQFPERVSRLVILNTAAFRMPAGKRFPWQLAFCRRRLFGPLLVRGLNGFCRYAVRSCVTREPMPPAVRKAYLAPYNSWRNRLAVLRFVQDIPLFRGARGYEMLQEVEAGLQQLADKPALICWGLRDFVFDRYFLDEWQKHLPRAEVHRFEDAGHYVLEDAADEIAPLVGAFLRDNPIPVAQSAESDTESDR
jgi:haloalkane dehalogenase